MVACIASCEKESVKESVNTKNENITDSLNADGESLLFVIAGQSNAEGAVFLEGLTKLQQAIPLGTQNLSTLERKVAREAVSNALGIFCEVEQPCIDNPDSCPDLPFSFSTADAVIDGLMNSSINWRQINNSYQHPTINLIAANYHNSDVVVLNANGEEVDNENCTFLPEDTKISGPFLERYTEERMVPLAPGFGALADDGMLSFGPELGFGIKVSEKFPKASILKLTMGGSSLNDSWRLDGTLYKALLNETQKALLRTNARLGGFIWFQGFNDQFENIYCQSLPNKYESNLKHFMTMVRKDLNMPNLPVVIIEARNGGELPTIQRAQNAVAVVDQSISLVPSKDLSECFHYDSGSQILIGERAGNAMLELLKK